MKWITDYVDQIESTHPEGEVVVSSGVSPSGTYHFGTLREVLTAEVLARELRLRGRSSRHIHVVDDLDVFRKVPEGLSVSYEKYLGKPLCDIPSPDGSDRSYADYYLDDLIKASNGLHLGMEVVRSHEKYREGFFKDAIEKTLQNVDKVKSILERISGRKLDQNWTPIQILEDGYLKNRPFISIDASNKTITYLDKDNNEKEVSYTSGDVKLNWRVDWPARWSLLDVAAEPFGRDHATKGGSYDTGEVICREIFEHEPPVPVPYNFINRTGDTKKMSKSKGDVVTAIELLKVLPPEVIWYFMLRTAPGKLLFFDQSETLMKLVDDFSELLAKVDKSKEEQKLLELCLQGVDQPTISNIPFTHLVSSYQASLRNADNTIEIIKRTEHKATADNQKETIKRELSFIDEWLNSYADEDIKFELAESVNPNDFTETEIRYMQTLAKKIENAPKDADGQWFHKAIYDLKETSGLQPKELFVTLYRALINKESGPRIGMFLSVLPRDWLIKRLNFSIK